MKQVLKTAMEAAEKLRPDQQDDIARMILDLASDTSEAVPPSHLADVLEGLAQAERGELASPAEIEAAFRRFG